MEHDEQLQRQARALGDPRRHAIYRLVADSPAPLDIATLTKAMGLHHNAVRQHVAKLRDAGLLEESVDEPHGRGRPRHLYRAAADLDGRWEAPDAYRVLAGLLAEAIRTGSSAREIGHRAGRRAVAEHGPSADPVDAIRAEAARLGFAPELCRRDHTAEVVLRHCPFSEVAADDPSVVCELHLGLAEGIAEATGSVLVRGLQMVDPYRAGCRLRLATVE